MNNCHDFALDALEENNGTEQIIPIIKQLKDFLNDMSLESIRDACHQVHDLIRPKDKWKPTDVHLWAILNGDIETVSACGRRYLDRLGGYEKLGFKELALVLYKRPEKTYSEIGGTIFCHNTWNDSTLCTYAKRWLKIKHPYNLTNIGVVRQELSNKDTLMIFYDEIKDDKPQDGLQSESDEE